MGLISQPRHRQLSAALLGGLGAECFFGLQTAAALEAKLIFLGLPPGSGTLATVLGKTGASVLTAIGANLVTNAAEEGRGAKINHDLDKASGKAIAAVVRKLTPDPKELPAKSEKLDKLADLIEAEHDPKTLEQAGGVTALPINASEILSDPSGYIQLVALDADAWKAYLTVLANSSSEIRSLGILTNIQEIAVRLEKDYTLEFYAQLKLSLNTDKKAFAGAVLRQLDAILKKFDSMQAALIAESKNATVAAETVLKEIQGLRNEFDFSAAQSTLDRVSTQFSTLQAEVVKLSTSLSTLPAQLGVLVNRLEASVKRLESVADVLSKPMLHKALVRRLDAQVKHCRDNRIGFYTPSLLRAILSVRHGDIENAIESISPGSTAHLRSRIESAIKALPQEDQAGVQYTAWENRVDILLAVQIAQAAGSPRVLDNHLMVSLLQGKSRTQTKLEEWGKLKQGDLEKLALILLHPGTTKPGSTPDCI